MDIIIIVAKMLFFGYVIGEDIFLCERVMCVHACATILGCTFEVSEKEFNDILHRFLFTWSWIYLI